MYLSMILTDILWGRGFINTNSKITVRLMTRDENVDINEELLEKRVRDAWEYRKKSRYRMLSSDFLQRQISFRELWWINFRMYW